MIGLGVGVGGEEGYLPIYLHIAEEAYIFVLRRVL